MRGELPWLSAPHCLRTSEQSVTEGEKRGRRGNEKKLAALKRARADDLGLDLATSAWCRVACAG